MIKDITGKRYGRLVVKSFDHSDKRGAYWLCACDCGKSFVAYGYRLRCGKTKSCGCLQDEHRREGFHRSHGMTDTPLYIIWCNMRARCCRKTSTEYYNYGGRGIKLCEAWFSFDAFAEWALSHGYADGLSIERIDVNGNYEPDNCKWIEPAQQSLNQRRSHFVTAFGKTQTIKEWADESGLKYDTIERRINQYGYTPEDAVTLPPHHAKKKPTPKP